MIKGDSASRQTAKDIKNCQVMDGIGDIGAHVRKSENPSRTAPARASLDCVSTSESPASHKQAFKLFPIIYEHPKGKESTEPANVACYT